MLIKSHNHPSRALSYGQISILGQACTWFLKQPGNGLLLFFRVDDFDMALKRARALVTRLEEEPHVNPNIQTMAFSLRDPDGYCITISALSALRPREKTA
jgi:hypothetical protein